MRARKDLIGYARAAFMLDLRRIERLAPYFALLVGAAILLVGLGRHGIWDPTELAFAESVSSGARSSSSPRLEGALVRAGFALFGQRDWPGRFFGALATLMVAVSALSLAARLFDRRTGAYAAILVCATPLVVLNARWMIGDGASLGLHSLLGLGLFFAAFESTSAEDGASTKRSGRALALGLALIAGVTVVFFRGALLGILPPLLAVGAVALIDPVSGSAGRVRNVLALVAIALALTLAFLVVRDAAGYSLLLGGVPGGESPPTFERYLKVAFHTLAPISPLFVIGAVRAIAGYGDDEIATERQRLALGLVLWATFSFGAATLYASRYGAPTFLAVVPVAVLAALTLREAEGKRPLNGAEMLVIAMLLGLILRDYALYPASPLAGVPVTAPTLAADFQPKHVWAALFVAFGVATCFAGASFRVDGERLSSIGPKLRAASDWLFGDRRGQILLILAAVLEVALIGFGAFGSALGVSSLVSRIARVLAVALPLGIPLGALLVAVALRLFSAMHGARMLPAIVVATLFGAYLQGPFLRDLSGDLSPRGLFETFNELRAPNERLARFDIRSRAFEYYADGEAIELSTRVALVEHLSPQQGNGSNRPARNWAMFRRDILPQVDREVRARTGQHLFLADGRSSDFVLATSSIIEGRVDANPLTRAVITASEARPQIPLSLRFRDVELIGYDLELPNGSSVGAGQSFRITWYWKTITRMTTTWRVFVHVDGHGQRINGDHDTVEGLLPTTEWAVGDVVRDTQELSVPATNESGDYQIYVGLFAGSTTRMPLVSGPPNSDNRGIAGTLKVR